MGWVPRSERRNPLGDAKWAVRARDSQRWVRPSCCRRRERSSAADGTGLRHQAARGAWPGGGCTNEFLGVRATRPPATTGSQDLGGTGLLVGPPGASWLLVATAGNAGRRPPTHRGPAGDMELARGTELVKCHRIGLTRRPV